MRLVGLFVIVLTAQAQPWTTHGMSVPEAHPRLWWTPERIAQGQAWLAANPFTPAACGIGGNSGCQDVALKHVLSGSSCQSAIDYMNGAVCTGTDCSPGSAGSDFARQNGEVLHTVFDWCYDALTKVSVATTTTSAITVPAVSTTVVSTSSDATGVRTITPASMSGISIGSVLVFNGGGLAGTSEQVTVTAAGASNFTANFSRSSSHWTGATIRSAQTVTAASMNGIYVWQPVTVDGEMVWVTSTTGSTFTAGFSTPHASGSVVTGPSMVSNFISSWDTWMAGVNAQTYGGPNSRAIENNYFWGQIRNDFTYGIMAYGHNGDNTIPSGLLDDGLRRYGRFQDALPSLQGGIALEGPDYGISITSYPLMPFQSALNLGNDQFVPASELYKQSVFGMIYATTPAPTWNKYSSSAAYSMFPFSDDSFVGGGPGTVLTGRNYNQSFMNWASNYYSALDVGKYARLWYNTVAPSTNQPDRWVLAVDSGPAAKTDYSALPLDFYAPPQRFLYGRKAWDTTSTAFHWQLGSGRNTYGGGYGDHGHQDFGNFSIWRGGRWLTREASGYSLIFAGYGLRALGSGKISSQGPLAHNTVVFGTPLYTDDVGQMPSSTKGNGTVTRLETAAGYTYAAADLTDQYLWDIAHSSYNRGAVVHVERELLFIRSLEVTVILDRVTTGDVTKGVDAGLSAADQVNTFVIHFETSPTLEDASHLTATNGDQALRLTTLIPPIPTRRIVNEADCAGCSPRGLYRVEIDTRGAAQRYFLHVLQGRDAAGSNLSASVADSNPSSATAGIFTVTLHPDHGANTVVVFNKGQSSVGGSVSISGGEPAQLFEGLDTIAYTDSGPAWAEGAQPYAIAQGSLPTGVVGSAYSQLMTTTGGIGPHTFAVTSGSLPAGLSLTSAGQISGIPTTATTASFTVTVTDAGNSNATANRYLSLSTVVIPHPSIAVSGVALQGVSIR